jgi:site-specific DNA recombinase
MEFLKRAAKQKPRPFDCVLIDDTSRFGRNLGDVLKLAEFFSHYGVSLHFVSPPLDSSDPNFYHLLVFKGMMDEMYSKDLAYKVKRGQEGRVLAGFNAGGPCYGYRNETVRDGNGKEIGVRLVIVDEQVEVVRRIFLMYASGLSLDKIVNALRAAGIPAPKPPRKNSITGWSTDGIRCMLRNKKYIGINERGRTTGVIDPETGRYKTKDVPEEEWVRKENPEWRILTDELWNRVQERLALKKKICIPKQGGLSRTERSQNYLFSGLISCGICAGSMSIVDGTAGGEVVRYGCGAHRYKGACRNSHTIRRDRLEQQLLDWLTRDLLEGDRIDGAVSYFQGKVDKHLAELHAEARRNAVNVPALRQELAEKKQEAWKLTDDIVDKGRDASRTVRERLAAAEVRIEQIEKLLALAREPEPLIAFTSDQLKEHLRQKFRDLQSVLTSAPLVGKQILRKHIRKITLTPGEADGKRVFYAAVDFELGGGNSGVVLTDGVDASMQQYGFSTITIPGPTLEACRVYRKRSHSQQNPATEHSVTVLPIPVPEVADATQASDSGLTAIHA